MRFPKQPVTSGKVSRLAAPKRRRVTSPTLPRIAVANTKPTDRLGALDVGASVKPARAPAVSARGRSAQAAEATATAAAIHFEAGDWLAGNKPKVKFGDSLSVHTFAVKSNPTAKPETEGFDLALRAELFAYRPEADQALIAAVAGASADAKPFRLSELPGAGHHAKRAAMITADLSRSRLSPEVRHLLVTAASTAIGPADEPLIRPIQALASASALDGASTAVASRIDAALSGAHNELEKVLILKSLGPRAASLTAPDAATQDVALSELERYAAIIRGVPPSLLLDRATILSSGRYGDAQTMRQQAGNTCVAAACLTAMGSVDPVVAWVLRSDPKLATHNPLGLAARLEAAVLTSDLSGTRGTTWDLPLTRGEIEHVGSLISSATSSGKLTEPETTSLLAAARPGERLKALGVTHIEQATDLQRFRAIQVDYDTHFPGSQAALDKLSRLYPDEPPEQFDGRRLLEWRKFSEGRPKGIDPETAANRFLTPRTHVDYNRVKYFYRLEADPAHPERLAQVIESGQSVLLRSGDPEDLPTNFSHCLAALDVRGKKGAREFFIADSMSASGRWMKQSAFAFSYFFGHSYPELGVGRRAAGRPEL